MKENLELEGTHHRKDLNPAQAGLGPPDEKTVELRQQNAGLRERLQDIELRLAIQATASRILGIALIYEAAELDSGVR